VQPALQRAGPEEIRQRIAPILSLVTAANSDHLPDIREGKALQREVVRAAFSLLKKRL
jgi:hypothetical protein